MKLSLKIAGAALLGLSAMAMTTNSASAAIACNAEGYCWHVRHHTYVYRPEYGVVVHPDNWRWSRTEHYRWREHRGRGYWRNGAWVKF